MCARVVALMGLGEFIEVLPPQMRVSQQWYQGTADAVYQNIYSIGSERSNYVFILSGDHIYKMNYAKMLQQHVDSGADVTVATIEIPAAEAAKQFGVIETDRNWRIVGFEEKPAKPENSPHKPTHCNASMGVYIFNTQLLIPILLADSEDPNPRTISARISCRASSCKTSRVCLQLHRREQQEIALLARRRNYRRLLRSEHGSGERFAGVQPLRQELAVAHLAASISAREIRFCRSEIVKVSRWILLSAGGSILSGGRVQNCRDRLRRAGEQLSAR